MSLRYMMDGSVADVPDIICAHCHKSISRTPPPSEVAYWFAFCSAECCASWKEKAQGKVLGV